MSRTDELHRAAALIRQQRWAALATIDASGHPAASMVAYAAEPDLSTLWLHLSRLASHTRNLLERGSASLVISESDSEEGDPQTLARVSVSGTVEEVVRSSETHERGQTLYLERLPDAEPLFGFGDFVLFRLVPEKIRYVGGFARAFDFDPRDLRSVHNME
jgi:putative heme iron utilization protein